MRRQPRDVITQPRHGYEKVRELWPWGWGTPWIFDRLRGRLLPYRCDEWHRTRDGLWRKAIAGGAHAWNRISPPVGIPSTNTAITLGQQALALDSGYTAGTSGDAVAVKFSTQANDTLTGFYFFITGYGGTAANVTSIDWEIRTGLGSPDTSGPGLVATNSVNPSSATDWVAVTGLSVALTAGTAYWLIIADANGNGTDFATVLRNASGSFMNVAQRHLWSAAQTTNGFSTTPTSGINYAALVAVFSSGTVIGCPFAVAGTVASDTNQKGLYIAGLTGELDVIGVGYGDQALAGVANWSGVNLWEGSTGPSGSPKANGTLGIYGRPGSSSPTGYYFNAVQRMAAATAYRVTWTYSGNLAHPVKYDIGPGVTDDLRAAMWGFGVWTAETTGPAWANDTGAIPVMHLLPHDLVEAGGGGGGADLFIRRVTP